MQCYQLNLAGLSLCVQGTLCRFLHTDDNRRFIPVHTGNTLVSTCAVLVEAVYPCAYREHCQQCHIYGTQHGLSLYIQGTRVNKKPPSWRLRFIPVHTGNTSCICNSARPSSVYPCTYREHNADDFYRYVPTGLSLYIQGTRLSALRPSNQPRFIPVHTGNTPIITYCFIIKIMTTKFLPIF